MLIVPDPPRYLILLGAKASRRSATAPIPAASASRPSSPRAGIAGTSAVSASARNARLSPAVKGLPTNPIRIALNRTIRLFLAPHTNVSWVATPIDPRDHETPMSSFPSRSPAQIIAVRCCALTSKQTPLGREHPVNAARRAFIVPVLGLPNKSKRGKW